MDADAIAYLYGACALVVLTAFVFVASDFVAGLFRAPPLAPIDPAALLDAAARLRRRRVQAQDGDVDCVVCLGAFQRPCEVLPCAHLFCEDCTVALFQAPNFQRRCPVCRTGVELVVPCFRRYPAERDAALIAASLPEPLRRFNGEAGANGFSWRGLFASGGFVSRHFFALPLLVRIKVVACFLFALVYLLSPIDLMSESTLGPLGYLDDVAVVIISQIVLLAVLRQAFA